MKCAMTAIDYILTTMGAAAGITCTKRKRVVLSIKDKLDIIELLKKCVSYKVICEKYGIGKRNIKKNQSKIVFKREMIDMGMVNR